MVDGVRGIQEVDPLCPIFVHGQLFPDGSAIDRLRGGRLIFWNHGTQQIGRNVTIKGQVYSCPTLSTEMEQLLRFPVKPMDFGTSEDLVADLQQDIVHHCGVNNDVGLIAAAAILTTWVPEALSSIPINVWGEHQRALLDFLLYVSRRGVSVIDPNMSSLIQLPKGIWPTLIVREISDRNLRRLASAGELNAHLVYRGRFVEFHSAVIVSTSQPLKMPAVFLEAPFGPESCRRISPAQGEELCAKYQPRLLAWRLTQHQIIASSQFDVVGFGADTRPVAQVLGATLEGANAVQTAVMMTLAAVDKERKSERRQTPTAAVLQAVLDRCHTGALKITVGEAADVANGALVGRGDPELSDRATGEIFRELNFLAKRRNTGYTLRLDQNTNDRIHILANDYGLLSTSERLTTCNRCQQLAALGDSK